MSNESDNKAIAKPQAVVDGQSLGDTLFRPHGSYTGNLDDRLLRSEVTGPFNMQWMHAYRKAVHPLYTEASSRGPFAVLTLFHESMMVNMDALQVFSDIVKGFAEEFPQWKGVAFVAPRGVEGRSTMDYLFATKVYGPAGVAYRQFADMAEAEAWLTTEVLPEKTA